MSDKEKTWHRHPIIVGILTALLASSLTAYYTTRNRQDDYSITANSCSESGPSKVFIENIATHFTVEIPSPTMPSIVQRVISISNNGLKMIDGETVYLSFEDIKDFDILSENVFVESALSNHKIITDAEGHLFNILLSKFNPHDTIYVVIQTDKPIGIGIDSKGAGYTLSSRFENLCGFFEKSHFKGFQAFQYVSKDCSDDINTISCKRTLKYKIPENFPPGPARLVFK